MTSEALAHLSNNLLYSAMAVYAGRDVLLRRRARVRLAAARRQRRGPARRTRELVAVGGLGRRTAMSSGRSLPGRTTTRAARLARADRLGRIAVSLTVLAFALHAASVLARGLSAGRPPWGNMFEFSTTGALAVTGVFLVLLTRKDVRYLGLRRAAGAADARASRSPCSTPSRRSWCRR